MKDLVVNVENVGWSQMIKAWSFSVYPLKYGKFFVHWGLFPISSPITLNFQAGFVDLEEEILKFWIIWNMVC